MNNIFKNEYFRTVFNECLGGKSLNRTLQNLSFSKVYLTGSGIDLGAKSDKASYYRFIKMAPDTKVVYSDLNPESENVLCIDLGKSFPLINDSQEFLILNNVLEHLFDYDICISESYRILKPGGLLIGSVPFLHAIHYDPDDFFRYSESSLKKIFEKHGFTIERLDAVGFGPFTTAATFVEPYIYFKIISTLFYFAGIALDKFLGVILPNVNLKKKYPLNYFFKCRKL